MADTYGAIRTDARALVSRLIHRHHQRFFPLTEAEVGKAVWSAVSSAAISRAACQLGRLTIVDNPLGMSINTLDLSTCRMKSSVSPAAHLQPSTGTVQNSQPSSEHDANGDISDFTTQQEDAAGQQEGEMALDQRENEAPGTVPLTT